MKTQAVNRCGWTGALAALVLLNAVARAQDTGSEPVSGDQAVQQLETILQQTQSLSADVVQLKVDQDGRELDEGQAELVMQKPGLFYWELISPYSELTVTDGELMWYYEPDLEQVTIQYFDTEEMDRTPLMLLNGNAEKIAATYEVTMGVMEDIDISRFILVPRSPGRLFERLAVTFRNAELIEMQFEDSLGQQTSLSFENIVRNQPLAADQFVFVPPAGVEIIDTTEE